MHKVNTIEDLRHEKRRLMKRSRELESQMRKDLTALKNEVDQSHLFSKVTRELITGKNDGMMLGSGLLTDFLIKRVFFRRANFFTKHAISSLAQNATREILSEKKTELVAWAGTVWQRIREKAFHYRRDGVEKKETAHAAIKKLP